MPLDLDRHTALAGVEPGVGGDEPEAVKPPVSDRVTERRWSTVNGAELVAVPPAVVTAIDPVVASAGTRAVILVEESTANESEAAPWKLTAVTPVEPVPIIVTVAPPTRWSG